MKKLIFASALLCATFSLIAQSVKTLGFQPDTVRPGEQTIYTILMSDTSPRIDIKSIPIPDGLQYVGSGQEHSFSSVNGQGMKRETRVNLVFVPSKEGEFEIKSWTLKDGKNSYTIDAAKIKADPNAPQRIAPQRNDPFARMAGRQPAQAQETIDLNKETSVKLSLAKEKIFVGEAVPCKLTVVLGGKIFQSGYTLRSLPAPTLKNGDAFNCAGFFKEPRGEQSQTDGTVTIVYDTIITPIKAGEHQIQFEVIGDLFSRASGGASIFSMMNPFGDQHRFKLQMQPLKIAVSELPPPPADFSNAVGNFKIQNVAMDETALSVGTPAIFTVKISGEGNFERMTAPTMIHDDEWKEYKPKISFEDASGGYSASGIKTFEYTIVPTKPDLEKSPTVKLVFFNPETQAYESAQSEAVSVSVAPSRSFAKRAQSEQKDPLGDRAAPDTSKSKSFFLSPLFWILQAAILAALIFAAAVRLRKNRFANDSVLVRNASSKKALKAALKSAKEAASSQNAKKFFENAAAALKFASGIASDMEPTAITLADAEKILKECGVNENEIAVARKLFDGADAIAFGGYLPKAAELSEMYAQLEGLCLKIS